MLLNQFSTWPQAQAFVATQILALHASHECTATCQCRKIKCMENSPRNVRELDIKASRHGACHTRCYLSWSIKLELWLLSLLINCWIVGIHQDTGLLYLLVYNVLTSNQLITILMHAMPWKLWQDENEKKCLEHFQMIHHNIRVQQVSVSHPHCSQSSHEVSFNCTPACACFCEAFRMRLHCTIYHVQQYIKSCVRIHTSKVFCWWYSQSHRS